MCEPVMLARTGLSIREHQERIRLRELAPDVPFAPVLRGWRLADYVLRTNDLADRDWTFRSLSSWSPKHRGQAKFLSGSSQEFLLG
jgi:hypothetical protein